MPTNDPARILDAYAQAICARDVEALLELYHPDVTVFDMWDTWLYDGRDAWRGMVEGWFASLGDERVEVTFDDVRATVRSDLAVVHAFVTYAGISAGGERLRAMNNRLSLTLTREDTGWRIVHEHSSAPASSETGQVNLSRPK